MKLRDDEVAIRNELAASYAARLAATGAASIVGLPADDSAIRWDLSIVITVASLDAWQALAALPAVAGVFDELATRAKVVKAWTFESLG